MPIVARDEVTLATITDVQYMRRYYLLQSSTLNAPAVPSTNPPSGAWGTTEPTYTEGSTNSLYTTDLVVFSDGTFDYLPVQKDSSYEAAKVAYNKAVAAQASSDANYQAMLSRGENLVTNGTGYLGTNMNFTQFTFDKPLAPEGVAGVFLGAVGYTGARAIDENIPIRLGATYNFAYQIRELTSGVTLSRYYSYIEPRDAYNNVISPRHYMFIADTTTTLAQELKPGDTTIKLTNSANWYGSTARPANTSTHLRAIIFWNYVDPGGKAWPQFTYSRSVSALDAWADGGVDSTTHTITLRTAWTGATFPAGTSVSNNSSGGSFMYRESSAAIAYTDGWVVKSGNIKLNPAPAVTAAQGRGVATFEGGWMPPGLAQIKIGWLLSYTGSNAGSKQAIGGVLFSEATAAQSTADAADAKTSNGLNLLSGAGGVPVGVPNTTWAEKKADRTIHWDVYNSLKNHVGKQITISYDIKCDVENTQVAPAYTYNDIGVGPADRKVTSVMPTTWTRWTHTTTVKQWTTAASGQITWYISAAALASGKFFYVKNLQIELGPTATDYSPSPTDAQTAAATAQTTATDAMTSANGRNSRIVSLSDATGTTNPDTGLALVKGDTWWKVDSLTTRNVIAQWGWSGTAWAPEMITDSVIASLDVNKLLVSGTARINQAVIDKLVADIGYFNAIIADSVTAQNIAASIANIIQARVENLTVTEGATIATAVISKLAAQLITSSTLQTDIDPTTGLQSIMDSAGYRLLDHTDPANPIEVVRLGPSGTNLLQIGATTIDASGGITGRTGTFTNLVLNGRAVPPNLDSLPRGVVSWGQLAKGRYSRQLVDQDQILGLEGTLQGGRVYLIRTNSFVVGTGGTASPMLKLHWTTDGQYPGPGGAGWGASEKAESMIGAYSGWRAFPPLEAILDLRNEPPTTTRALRAGVTLSGSGGVWAQVSSIVGAALIFCEDLGTNFADRGGPYYDTGGQVVPKVRTIQRWHTTGWANYYYAGARDYSTDKPTQGQFSNVNRECMFFFDDLTGPLTGATIHRITLRTWADHWNNAEGGTGRWHWHGYYGSIPESGQFQNFMIATAGWPRGAVRSIDIIPSEFAAWQSGARRGFGFATADTNLEYYGVFSANVNDATTFIEVDYEK